MRVFTATEQTQGQRPGDFHRCIEGELVMPPPLTCDRDARDPDGGCGCGRGWAGLYSHRATTTAMIRDLDGIDLRDYTTAIAASLNHQGWNQTDPEATARHLARLAADYPTGSVLGHRLRALYVRDIPPANITPAPERTPHD